MIPIRRRVARLTAPALLLLGATAPPAAAQWTQWGGPNRDFTVEGVSLSPAWPPAGPRELWSRDFGEGYSGVLADRGRLYGVRRSGQQDVATALDEATGQTIWETAQDAPLEEGMDAELGPGPISTPLLAGERLFTVSSTVRLHAFDAQTGALLWGRDLRKDMRAAHMGRGYGASPIAWKHLVILLLGGERGTEGMVAAFEQATGKEVWRAPGFKPGYASPILVRVAGEEQLVVTAGALRAGLDPATGASKWRLTAPASAESTMSTPVFGPDGLLFTSSAYGDGSRVIRLERKGADFSAVEQWYSRHMRVMYGTALRIGDTVYGSSGDFGPAFLTAADVQTGKVLWRKRGFARAHLLRAGDKVLILDEEGDLAIADLSPEDLKVHSRAHVIDRLIWTPPTLSGTRLILRNRTTLKALDLGGAAPASASSGAAR